MERTVWLRMTSSPELSFRPLDALRGWTNVLSDPEFASVCVCSEQQLACPRLPTNPNGSWLVNIRPPSLLTLIWRWLLAPSSLQFPISSHPSAWPHQFLLPFDSLHLLGSLIVSDPPRSRFHPLPKQPCFVVAGRVSLPTRSSTRTSKIWGKFHQYTPRHLNLVDLSKFVVANWFSPIKLLCQRLRRDSLPG